MGLLERIRNCGERRDLVVVAGLQVLIGVMETRKKVEELKEVH